MIYSNYIFYTFAIISIIAALMVITARNPVRAVLWLVFAFFNTACIWLMLQAEFLAVTLVLVYVGAVMVLFLFVVMMLDVEIATIKGKFVKFLPIGALVGIVTVFGLAYIFNKENLSHLNIVNNLKPENYSNINELGQVLFINHLYAFELAGILLLVAIIAAISLTFRGKQNSKMQNPSEQVKVRKQDRLRIVKNL